MAPLVPPPSPRRDGLPGGVVGERTPFWSKWLTFAACCLLQCCAGLSYAFPIYAPLLKERLRLSQTEIAGVGSAVNLGGYFAIVAGGVYDALKEHHRLGPRIVVWLGALCCLCGYLGMWLMATGAAPPSYAQLLVFAAAAGNTGVWLDTAALVVNVSNLPNDRGLVVGVLKSFLGLASSIWTSVYVTVFDPDAARFLLTLALLPPALCLALSGFVNRVPFVELSEAPPPSGSSGSGGGGGGSGGAAAAVGGGAAVAAAAAAAAASPLLLSFALVGALAVFQMLSAVVVAQHHLGRAAKDLLLGGMLALLAAAACAPLCCGGGLRARYAHPYAAGDGDGDGDGDSERRSGGGGAGGSGAGGSSSGGSSPRATAAATVEGRLALLHAGGGGVDSVGVGGGGAVRARAHHRAGVARPVGGLRTAAERIGLVALAPGRRSLAGDGAGDDDGGGSGGEAAPLLASTKHLAGGGGPRSSSPPLFGEAAAAAAAAGGGGGGQQPLEPAQQQQPLPSMTTRQMLGTLDAWLLFLQFTIGAGACLAFLNNIAAVVRALGGDRDGGVVAVSLFSVSNAAGRLAAGYVPERALHRAGTPRTAFLAAAAGLTAAAALALAFAPLRLLPWLAMLCGACFGAHWSLVPAIISDLFGLRHYAQNYSAMQFAPAIGSLLLAARVMGYFADRAAEAHHDRGGACVGADCFRRAWLALAALAAAGAAASWLLTRRSRRAYARIAAHLRAVAGADAGAAEQAARASVAAAAADGNGGSPLLPLGGHRV